MGDLDFRHKAMGDLSAVAGERSKEKRTEARGPENSMGAKGGLETGGKDFLVSRLHRLCPGRVAPIPQEGWHTPSLSPQPTAQTPIFSLIQISMNSLRTTLPNTASPWTGVGIYSLAGRRDLPTGSNQKTEQDNAQ